ncbi:MAG TPA: hypothetical protein VM265_06820 [Sphingomicrobium sp.]|nr:hypothetical protein [Sphingomicrobium sp.]
MTRKIALSLLLLATPALGGCAVQAALAAAELAGNLPQSKGPSNAHLRPEATRACTERAAQHGTVYLVDVEQRRPDRIIVWGSVTDAQQQRRTFECHFTTGLASFRLRDI